MYVLSLRCAACLQDVYSIRSAPQARADAKRLLGDFAPIFEELEEPAERAQALEEAAPAADRLPADTGAAARAQAATLRAEGALQISSKVFINFISCNY